MFKNVPDSYKDPYWQNIATSAEKESGLPEGLLRDILNKGERSNNSQVSPVGAKTPFQIMPKTRDLFLKKYGVDAYASPQAAAKVAALHLKESADRNKGDWNVAVTEYIGGTDKRNWGKTTRDYTQRVTGRGIGGSSVADRVTEARERINANKPKPLAMRIADDLSGKNGPEAKAAMQLRIDRGEVIPPTNLKLANAGVKTVQQSTVDAYNSGEMDAQERAEFFTAVNEGFVKLPKGAQLTGPRERGFVEGIREAVTGAERATAETEAATDYAAMPELNQASWDSFKAGLGTMAGGPEEMAQVIKANFPNVQVLQDAKGNFLLKSGVDGQTYAIKPGFQMSDVPRAAAGLIGGVAGAAGKTILGAARAAGLYQTAVESTQAATGGNFNIEDIALASAAGGGGHVAGQAISAAAPVVSRAAGRATNAISERLPFRGARGADEIIETSPPRTVVGVADEVVPTPNGGAVADDILETVTPTSATVEAAEAIVPPPSVASLDELAQDASRAGGAIGGRAATARLAEQAAPNPEVLEAAKRLGVEDYLQPDHITTSQAFRELAQAAKSVPGSAAREAEMEGLQQVGRRADEIMAKLGAESDLSTLGTDIKEVMGKSIDTLVAKESVLYDQLRDAIGRTTPTPAANTVGVIKESLREFGGDEGLLSTLEKKVLSSLDKKDGVPTYGAVDRVRKDVGLALAKAQGPFKDEAEHVLSKIYSALKQDLGAIAEQKGMKETLDEANALTVARKGIEDDMKSLYGRALDQSIVGKTTAATQALAKGDAEKFAKMLAALPKDQREKFALSALRSTFGKMTKNGEMNFNSFANWFGALQKNRQSYSAIMSNLPSESKKVLHDLYTLSDSIAKATRENITTGRVMAAKEAINGTDNVMSAVNQRIRTFATAAPFEAATSAIGLPGAGLGGAIAGALSAGKTTALQRADELFASPDFKELALKIARGEETVPTKKKLLDSEPFKRFARATFMPYEKSAKEKWLNAALISGADDMNNDETQAEEVIVE